jgi:hypothetical protein
VTNGPRWLLVWVEEALLGDGVNTHVVLRQRLRHFFAYQPSSCATVMVVTALYLRPCVTHPPPSTRTAADVHRCRHVKVSRCQGGVLAANRRAQESEMWERHRSQRERERGGARHCDRLRSPLPGADRLPDGHGSAARVRTITGIRHADSCAMSRARPRCAFAARACPPVCESLHPPAHEPHWASSILLLLSSVVSLCHLLWTGSMGPSFEVLWGRTT